VVNFFGGTDLNLSQSDINGVAVLDLTQVFGGTKLIVPSNWKVQSEVVAVFGGLDDKRRDLANPDPNKVLVLKGTCIFGGIDIKSF
jgi:predicted membrane protein